jgi:UDP-N-acetylglucosamine/UDP-N-acetylgalactosamine diphosphorylase
MTDDGGNLAYWPGSIAIHLFGRPFLERVAGALPYHVAHKAVPFVDDAGRTTAPKDPNAVKYEMFIFDAMPMARKVNIVETPRADEFAPVKNATGADSAEVTKAMISAQAGRWLDAAGVAYPKKTDGEPAVALEIGPLAGVDLTDFLRRRWRPPAVVGPTLIEEET